MQLSIAYDDASARGALEDASRRGVEAMRATMFRLAQRFLDIADPLVPRRSGRLWASRYAARTWPVEAGLSADYAAAVEELHEPHANGQWKAITTALAKLANEGETGLQREFAEAFERGETLSSAPARHPTTGAGGAARARPVGRRR